MNLPARFSPRRRSRPSLPGPGWLRTRAVLGAGAGAAVLALAAGCSVAPPGATYDSAAVGPVRSGPAGTQNFAPFPVPAIWSGENNATFEMVVKAKTGTVSPGGFRFIVAPNMVFWLNCIGAGKAQLASAGIKLKWSVPCGDGTSPGGINFRPASSAVGHADEVYVTVSAGSRWEVRIDAIASAGVSPVRGQVRRLSGAGPPPPGRHPLM